MRCSKRTGRLCGGGSDDGSSGGCGLSGLGRLFSLGLLSLGRLFNLGSSGLTLSGVLEGSNGGGLLDLGRVLVDLGRGSDLSLGLGLEQVTDAGRETTTDLGGLGDLLLLLFLLLSTVSQEERTRSDVDKDAPSPP